MNTLSLNQAHAQTHRPGDEAGTFMNAAAPRENRRILLVDDNQAIHEDFRKIFASAVSGPSALDQAEVLLFGEPANPPALPQPDFKIDSAYQGQEALRLLEAALERGEPYAMAFMDVRMPPGWDGIETTARLWEKDPHLQVVICTAYSDYSWEAMVAKLGHRDRLVILKKPFDNIEVLQLAHTLTEKWQILQQAQVRLTDLESMVSERTMALEATNESLQTEIVERQYVEEQRNKIEVQLRHAQKMEAIGQLASGIAHEINTPTQFIGDNLRFLQESFRDLMALHPLEQRLFEAAQQGPVPPELLLELKEGRERADLDYLCAEIPKAVAQALEGVARVSKIVRAMKEFSHPSDAEKQKIDLRQAIESTATVSRNEWKYVAELTTDFDPDMPHVPALPGEFNQVILNIIVNAAHAIGDVIGDGSKGKGRIHVSTKRLGAWAEIRIRDTGTGIPESARTRIFEPFFTTKGVGRGTGQGLAIAHSVIVDKHGGTLAFETETGQGTTFIIRLPLEAHDTPAGLEQA